MNNKLQALCDNPIEHQQQRCITFELIDQLHEVRPGRAYESFARNRNRFVEGKHFYRVPKSGLNPDYYQRGLETIVLTEKGYLLLIKPMRDDVSWQIMEELIDHYFRLQQGNTIEYHMAQTQLLLVEKQRQQQGQLDDHEERIENLEKKQPRSSTECYVTEHLHRREGGRKFVRTPDGGEVDLVLPLEIVEVKNAKRWRDALRQIESYAKFYGGYHKRIHLFGELSAKSRREMEHFCSVDGVRVTWADPSDHAPPPDYYPLWE